MLQLRVCKTFFISKRPKTCPRQSSPLNVLNKRELARRPLICYERNEIVHDKYHKESSVFCDSFARGRRRIFYSREKMEETISELREKEREGERERERKRGEVFGPF